MKFDFFLNYMCLFKYIKKGLIFSFDFFNLEQKKYFKIFIFILFSLLSFIIIIPILGDVYAIGDIIDHSRLAASAKHTIFKEGIFIPFYSNDMGWALQPIFGYYSLPIYYFSALFSKLGLNIYHSLLLASCFFYSWGAYGVFLICRYFRVSKFSAFLGGICYLYAPYAFTLIYARGAFAEISAWGIYPLLMYALIRTFFSRGKKWGIRLSLLSMLLLIAHKIFFPWIVLVFVLFCFNFISISISISNLFNRLNRIIISIIWIFFGMLISAPHWMSAYLALPYLDISKHIGLSFNTLSSFTTLIRPYFWVHPDCTTPRLATQYGLPVVLGVFFLLFKKNNLKWAVLLPFFIVFVIQINFLGVAELLPTQLKSIQFLYRLLLINTLFGSVAFAFFSNDFLLKFNSDSRKTLSILFLSFVFICSYSFSKHQPPKMETTFKNLETTNFLSTDYSELEFEKIRNTHLKNGWRFPSQTASGYLYQNANILLNRKKGDELLFCFSGHVHGEFKKSEVFFKIFLNNNLLKQIEVKDYKFNEHIYLPKVNKEKKEIISFYLLDQKENQIIAYDFKAEFFSRYQKKLKLTDLKIRDNSVSFSGFLEKEKTYILPVLYSRLLKVNSSNLHISAHREGILLTPMVTANYFVKITRDKEKIAQICFFIGLIMMLLLWIYFKIKYWKLGRK